MAGDTALAIVALAPALAAVILTDRGWDMITWAGRRSRIALRPSEGTCAKFFWHNLSDGPLHVCTSSQCHSQTHVKDKTCWDRTLTTVLNQRTSTDYERLTKPQCLLLSNDLLYVDANVIRAFIIMAAKADHLPSRQRPDAKDIDFAGVAINRQIIKKKRDEPDILVLHLQGMLQRTLSKSHVQRILDGYPPLSQDPWQRSIFSDSDLRRGGWIAAIGLDEGWDDKVSFLPIYVDSVEFNDKRGGLFWRSIDRIIAMVSNIWLPVFQSTPGGYKVKQALDALTYMRKEETDSGFTNLFDVAILQSSPTNLQQQQIIRYFNGEPTLAHGNFAQFRQDWEALLDAVLVAVVLGTSRCVSYVKNPGREMNFLSIETLLDSSDIYVRGC